MNPTKNCALCGKIFEKQSWESKAYWAKKLFCSMSCAAKDPARNLKMQKARIAALQKGDIEVWNKGKTGLQEAWNKGKGDYARKLGFGKWMFGRKGELSNVWKGEYVGYGALHDWVYRELGSPNKCTHCGKSALHPQGMHWANKSNEYKRDLNDWIRLCAKCHKEYDKGRKQNKYDRNF